MSGSVGGAQPSGAEDGTAHMSDAHLGLARWLSIHDDLLRGLTHTLSNRIGTVAAAAHMVELQPASLGNTAATLHAEGERLEALLQLFRVLPRAEQDVPEPVIPTDMITQATALQSHHAHLRAIPITVIRDGDVQPAYADPSALTLAVAVILGTAQRATGSSGRVDVTISSTTDVVRIVATGIPAEGAAPVLPDELVQADALADAAADALANALADAAAVRWLLAGCGGLGEVSAHGAALEVPTLQAARRARRS